MEFWPYFCEQRNSHLILPKTGILALFLYTLVFWCYLSKPWDPGLISKILELWSYPCEHWISGPILYTAGLLLVLILPKIGILIFFFQALEFWSFLLKTLEFLCYSSTAYIAILIFSQNTLILALYYKHWNSYLIFPHVGILVLLLEHWDPGAILPNIGIAALFF